LLGKDVNLTVKKVIRPSDPQNIILPNANILFFAEDADEGDNKQQGE
jgi:hypothetical protein